MTSKNNARTAAKPTVRRSQDETSAAALDIIKAELAARLKKTAMLRALRLAQEPVEEKPVKKAVAKKKR
ncbi:hypothetical protein OE766_06155 [Pararhizobium sp. YC-54]|uniref:hypothetical protein n=1 Tax=Pararhizobium sp. YC-54 TaxID=2986920 RepID=UPI0021F7EE8F|nr:hypothetical protein [Pararhizobium sp. YC-54]MCV9997822.1 hypothetical protein [Pararhizobium sp. YC-54]